MQNYARTIDETLFLLGFDVDTWRRGAALLFGVAVHEVTAEQLEEGRRVLTAKVVENTMRAAVAESRTPA